MLPDSNLLKYILGEGSRRQKIRNQATAYLTETMRSDGWEKKNAGIGEVDINLYAVWRKNTQGRKYN